MISADCIKLIINFFTVSRLLRKFIYATIFVHLCSEVFMNTDYNANFLKVIKNFATIGLILTVNVPMFPATYRYGRGLFDWIYL